MVFAQRNNSVIVGLFANSQAGYAEEELAEDDAEVVAFRNPPPDPRAVAIRADVGRIDLLARLKTATPAQIDAYIDANVTTLAQAREFLKRLAKVIALDQRNGG